MDIGTKPKHLGRNISRIRELRDMKQEALAMAVGVTQQTISHMENSATVDEDKLEKIAEALGVSVEAIKNFNDDNLISYFNTFNEVVSNSHFGNNNNCTFNPLDKLMESHEENKQLYERLLQAEKEKNEYLEKLLETK